MPARPKVGAQIRRARQLLDMRQQDLADKLGVSRNTVDSWENDRAYPQRTLAKLEQVLGVTLGGEAAQPEPWRVPTDDWEQRILDDRYLSDEDKRLLISSSRDARAEAVRVRRARRQQRADQSGQPDAGQSGRRT